MSDGATNLMQIQIHSNGLHNSDAVNARLTKEVEAALKVWRGQVTRVEAHLHDDNGPKSGQDKRCVLEIRLAGIQPLAVEASSDDMYMAIAQAAGKAERAVRHKLERHEAHRSSHGE
jgi:ribosomal subunit interface protein